jgi:hypothetical protein
MNAEAEAALRRALLRALEARRPGFHVSDRADPWGVVITRRAMTGVQVWLDAREGRLTLGLTTPATRGLLPDAACPPDAVRETSASGWPLLRCTVAPVAPDAVGTPDALAALAARIDALFGWFTAVRLDRAPQRG